MKKIKRYLAIALFMVVLLSQSVSAQTALPNVQDLQERIEEYVMEHEQTTAGMMVSVFRRGESLYTGYFGYADKENARPVTADTVMEWGSATKLLVWVSVMQLWEQGRLDLEADISIYLPEGFLTNHRFDTPVTMLHLMNHTAGYQESYADLFVKEYDAVGTLESSLAAHKPVQIFEPGTVAAYSNWGVALAGWIVERVSGESFADYVHHHIFEPLEMNHSAILPDLSDNSWVQAQRTKLQCYTANGDLIPDCFYYITLYPAGMCTSTLEDFEKFAKALMDENTPLFQTPATLGTLFTPTAYLAGSDIPSNYHGFWMIPFGVEVVGHGGNTAGCSSYLLLDLQGGVGAVVMTNQQNETCYNTEMMKMIFGEEDAALPEQVAEGIYRSARTVREGPFKLISLSFIPGTSMEPGCWTVDGEKLCMPYGDMTRVSPWLMVLELGLVLLWVLALALSLVSLPVKLIRRVIWTLRKKKGDISLGKWSAISALMQVVTVVLVALMAVQALSYAVSCRYLWIMPVLLALTAGMIAMAVWGVLKNLRIPATKKRKCYNWAMALSLIISAANLVYWNLFCWWLL